MFPTTTCSGAAWPAYSATSYLDRAFSLTAINGSSVFVVEPSLHVITRFDLLTNPVTQTVVWCVCNSPGSDSSLYAALTRPGKLKNPEGLAMLNNDVFFYCRHWQLPNFESTGFQTTNVRIPEQIQQWLH